MNDHPHTQAWLNGLKVGDEVVTYRDSLRIERVTRATNSTLWVGYFRYRRKDGRSIGEWHTGCVYEPTPETRERVDRARLERLARRAMGACQLEKLDTDTLRAVIALLPVPPTS